MEKFTKDVVINDALCQYSSKGRDSAFSVKSFQLKEGESISLVGRSGSGKSSLLNIVAGFLPAKSGSVQVCGHELVSLNEGKRDLVRRNHIGMVFQSYQLLEEFNVIDNVNMGGYFSSKGGKDVAEGMQLLEKVGLADYVTRMPKELSVGQRQRVSIVRALLKKPEILLADEPTGALDQETGKEVCDLLFNLISEMGSSMILVTHDKGLAEMFPRSVDVSEVVQWEK